MVVGYTMTTERAASEGTFSALVQSRGPALLRLAYLLTGHQQDAQDLLQTALSKAYAAWSRLQAPEAGESYIRTIMVREAARARRRHWDRRETLVADPPELPSPSRDEEGHPSEMWRALAELPPGQRAVIVLRYYEQLSEGEIAAVLGCSRGTVKSQASKGLAKLAERLQGNGNS